MTTIKMLAWCSASPGGRLSLGIASMLLGPCAQEKRMYIRKYLALFVVVGLMSFNSPVLAQSEKCKQLNKLLEVADLRTLATASFVQSTINADMEEAPTRMVVDGVGNKCVVRIWRTLKKIGYICYEPFANTTNKDAVVLAINSRANQWRSCLSSWNETSPYVDWDLSCKPSQPFCIGLVQLKFESGNQQIWFSHLSDTGEIEFAVQRGEK
jgi:hypothetical protein